MKKLLSAMLALLMVVGMNNFVSAEETLPTSFPDLKVTPSKKSIKVGDDLTYYVDGLDFDTDLTPDREGKYMYSFNFVFFSEMYDSSIQLQSIELPKVKYVTTKGETYGGYYAVMDYGQNDGVDVQAWLSSPDYTTVTREQLSQMTNGFTRNAFRVYLRSTDEGSYYGRFEDVYKSMKMAGPIKFNYKVVGDGTPGGNKPNPYFSFTAEAPESGAFSKTAAFGYSYFSDYELTREIVSPFNPVDRSVSIKYTAKNTGPYNETRVNIYEEMNGFVPTSNGWTSNEGINVLPILDGDAYKILAPGEIFEHTEKYILDANSNEFSYIFKGGLFTNGDFTNKTVAEDIVVDIPSNKVNVAFESNGGSTIEPMSVDKGSTIAKPLDPTREGYTFAGWYKDVELTTAWNFENDTVTSNITLYAKWTKDVVEEKYTVNFESNGGTTVDALSDIVSGSTIAKPLDPIRKGYKFAGWYKDAELTTEWNFESDTVTSNITLYAKWSKDIIVNKYIVNFNSNGGTFVKPYINLISGSKIVKPMNPTREGYTFAGWYKDVELTKAWNFKNDKIVGNTTLYAKWDKDIVVEKYTVNFDSNGGSDVAALHEVVSGSTIAKPVNPTKSGYSFMGWYKDSGLTSEWNFESDTVTSDITLYAKWQKDVVVEDKYTVNFETNGGSHIDPLKDIVKGSKISAPVSPTKLGYTFAGWYKESELTTAWNFESDVVSENITLYAKWTKDVVVTEKYTVTFDTQGGSKIPTLQGIVSGNTISKPTNPTKDGYTFAGWYKEKDLVKLWDFANDKIVENTTLYAKWNKVTKPVDPLKPVEPTKPVDPTKPKEVVKPTKAGPKTGVSSNVKLMSTALLLSASVLIVSGIKKKSEDEE